jgi:hypothetical protein
MAAAETIAALFSRLLFKKRRNGCAGSLGSFVLSKNGQIDRRCSGWMGFGILRAGRMNVTDHPYSK